MSKKQNERLEKRRKKLLKDLDEGLRWVMGDKRGRRVIWWVLHDLCGFFGTSFTSGVHDSAVAVFSEGRRRVAVLLLDRLRMVGIDSISTLIKEFGEIKPDEDAGGNVAKDEGEEDDA